jgi:hypothetical protein
MAGEGAEGAWRGWVTRVGGVHLAREDKSSQCCRVDPFRVVEKAQRGQHPPRIAHLRAPKPGADLVLAWVGWGCGGREVRRGVRTREMTGRLTVRWGGKAAASSSPTLDPVAAAGRHLLSPLIPTLTALPPLPSA